MSQPYIGQIDMFGGNFAPKGFAFCNGQQMSVAQNQALFSLINTIYGGNGVTTFTLPNLQSSLSIHMGQSPGNSNYNIGQFGGAPDVTLSLQQIPQHNHILTATGADATQRAVTGTDIPAKAAGDSTPLFYANAVEGKAVTMHPMAVNACGMSGSSLPHSNLMPSLCITFIIALQGIFPSRN